MFPFQVSHLAKIPGADASTWAEPPEPFLGKHQVATVFPLTSWGGRALWPCVFSMAGSAALLLLE